MTEKNKAVPPVTDTRASGILLHISSLPGEYGIGDLGRGSRDFIDFLQHSGQSYWQMLPLGPTEQACGNSPYMSCSAFAGNPLLISPEQLIKDGWIRSEQLPPCPADFSEYTVAFDQTTVWKKEILALAWQSFKKNTETHQAEVFFKKLTDDLPWVGEYGLFMALKKKFGQKGWSQWPTGLRRYETEAVRAAEKELQEEVQYYQFEQYLFFQQWAKLHAYAAEKGIRIIGDLPVYVALDSSDVWANQAIFMLSPKSCRPSHISGVPPDYFSKTGQLWGNPLYHWHSRTSAVKEQLYSWWEQRLRTVLSIVDVIRIDHFRGFESYWSVPAKEKTALNGAWKKGPGLRFFREMEKRLGSLPVIAEDLGVMTPEVEKLRDTLGYPGMKILLFAFDGRPDNAYLPYNMTRNCVVYTGTHDNDTAVGWYLNGEVAEEAKKQAKDYVTQCNDDVSFFHEQMIYLAQSSVAGLCILPMQDVLGFGNDCRMNTPGTGSNNWQWRCAPRFITDDLARHLRKTTAFFGRLPAAKPEKEKNSLDNQE